MRESKGLLTAVLLLAGVLAVGWGLSHLGTVQDLRATERTQDFHQTAGGLVSERGFGPLRVDVLVLHDESVVHVPPPAGGHSIAGERRELRVGDAGGAYYPTAPVPDGLWLRFALVALGSVILGLTMIALATRHLGFVVFGQRDPAAKPFGWVPGGGTHGSGKAPPYVPYNPDWDPKNRTK